MSLNRFFERFRHDDDMLAASRKAVARTEEIRKRVEQQWPEVHRADRFAGIKIQENHLSPKIRAAIRGDR